MPDSHWAIEPIRRDHVRDTFDCGNAGLNDFIRKYARQSEDLAIARTSVAVRPSSLTVSGYYTMRTGQVQIEALPPQETKRFPKYPVPIIHLARLAVARSVQGQGLGEILLLDALERAWHASRAVAAYAIEVLAIEESARRFYLKYGFKELTDDRLHLYLPMQTVEKLFSA